MLFYIMWMMIFYDIFTSQLKKLYPALLATKSYTRQLALKVGSS